HENAQRAIKSDVTIEKLNNLPIKAKIVRAKSIKEDNLKVFSEIEEEIISQISGTTN
ncbi:unnamed protein product, partial [marine sediment metagenome]